MQQFFGTMDFSENGFFSNFPELESFWIHDNEVYGNFINFDCISSEYLPNLRELRLGNNKFTGSLFLSMESALSPSLTHFELYNNDFSNSVEWDIFANLRNLKTIDIAGNGFDGGLSMSHSLYLPESLEYFDIDYNNFEGEIDWNIFEHLYNLTELHLNHNEFIGNIDWEIISDIHNNGNLKILILRNNDFSGLHFIHLRYIFLFCILNHFVIIL